ncbi:MAG: YbhB/YbcL family Raf kinase inhibitor-like protein [Nocardioidaceae bacterium]
MQPDPASSPTQRRGTWRFTVYASVLALVASAGCSSDTAAPDEPATTAADTITVTSSAIPAGGAIPERFTCDGDSGSPPLRWNGVPVDAGAVALVVDDPDAPDGPFVHWVVLDIPTDITEVAADDVPGNAPQAANSFGNALYDGPCPPSGTHHYRFTIYALSAPTGLSGGADLGTALQAIDDKATARGRLIGTYRHAG